MSRTPQSSRTVLVGCRIPNGLQIQLRSEDGVNVLGEARLKGSVDPGTPDMPGINAPRSSGIGLTTVDADFWEAFVDWAEKNKYAPFVRGYIFAASKEENLLAEAKEKTADFNGFSGLNVKDPSKDERLAEVRGAQITDIKND